MCKDGAILRIDRMPDALRSNPFRRMAALALATGFIGSAESSLGATYGFPSESAPDHIKDPAEAPGIARQSCIPEHANGVPT
jgi:hypothetical protein